ncbi:single-stranded DNA-binding protein [Clostridium felsineum]|uniref:Single-stranded DNA-binding protein n=1 Tax=Clostridium felsineum TaxID=36839 RepID=A0A1S8LY97_9CLOT|nr:single-stranded DNA-binding protein [Clostridium felsineum]MCR3761136.1 single-stranded DNA-binding protein [Clostridium felsineum]URZ02792.1 Single-stranded DNA-binding protein [Clostridium felsineum]URZ08882.1 Single-stranded DNA-binding protein [Clostridium felsineum]URZ09510.1 Single-stranded DNA-binding protein [Clostridium felsineum]URZ14136.1 Single-stranded DNA-binding protein [Clostridium felsineum DSM 794]
MNKVVLIGRLTKDPELKFTPGTGTAVASFTLAVDRRFKKEGQQEADFVPIVVWGKQAESTANYMSKGKLMGVSGRIQTRSYDAKDGTRRYVTEIVAEEVQFLEWGSSNNNTMANDQFSNGNENGSIGLPDNNDITPIDDGDIPF